MLTVACVLRSGGIYDASWVARLRAGVARHLPLEHRFVCLSDVDVPCERIPLEHDWPRWWSKIELFKLRGPVLALDLDTVIVGDLLDVVRQALEPDFTVLQDFYRPDGIGSGLMAWSADLRVVYEIFAQAPDEWRRKLGGRGDQGFIEQLTNPNVVYPWRRIVPWQQVLPGQVVSYKVHCRGMMIGEMANVRIPRGARIVCLHGKPKFADMPANDPVRVAWELAA